MPIIPFFLIFILFLTFRLSDSTALVSNQWPSNSKSKMCPREGGPKTYPPKLYSSSNNSLEWIYPFQTERQMEVQSTTLRIPQNIPVLLHPGPTITYNVWIGFGLVLVMMMNWCTWRQLIRCLSGFHKACNRARKGWWDWQSGWSSAHCYAIFLRSWDVEIYVDDRLFYLL